ncbi:glycine oxidase ThiO [Chroococcus sp. FPU101]|uniref:glycine oxidase ThiO n=1 Tax=Chroococcus sp. FPU101 TaxID=1974212 RepID=UPI001A8D833B|nr:glycine oxidase ThiO [Chroococcus sp. FPU101]GFE67511.1 glycine oxidase ThiO [Chroococcus sp. FPU101]
MNSTSEIIVIGGGIIGLAIAVDLKLRGATVTVLSRDFQQAASHAAAGMLAPYAEKIPPGAMLDLCLKSRWLYPEWIRKIEDVTGLDTGYHPCGILSLSYDTPSSIDENWLDRESIKFYQAELGSNVVGGWWYPDDAQVDNRKLVTALRQAALNLGVELIEGVTVSAIQQQKNRILSLLTSKGEYEAQTYILASGSWASLLLPLPVYPVKGQMAAVRMPTSDQTSPLHRILFGPQTYLVPRQDGRLIIGATSEKVGWKTGNTPDGLQTLFSKAIQLYPPLKDWPLSETWWGFRPATPDELPILGISSCDNLILATGHYRNGILLSPVTASMIADLVLQNKTDPLLHQFHYDRFSKKPSSSSITLNSTAMPLTLLNGSIPTELQNTSDELVIAGRKFRSRLMTGSGKYANLDLMRQSIVASGCEIVTVAVRRVQTKAPGHEGLAEALDWSKIWMLPNTAGCQTAEEAIRVARLGREMAKLLGQEDNNFIKLEVIPDAKYLLPDPIGTLQAAEQLVKEGFAVLPYINADPLLAKRLEEIGCVTVMPLGSPIGSGQGIKNAANISIIIEESKIPVVVDAGIGTPSEASYAMELGADALLINSAIALAQNPVAMGQAMGMATVAGRLAYLAGRMPIKQYASASSPLTGTIG